MCRENEGRRCSVGRVVISVVVFAAILLVGGRRALPFAVGGSLICLWPPLLLLPFAIPFFILSIIFSPVFALISGLQGRRLLMRIDELDGAEAELQERQAAVEKLATFLRSHPVSESFCKAMAARAFDRERPSRELLLPILDRESKLAIARDATDPLAPAAWFLLVDGKCESSPVPREQIVDAWAKALSASNGGEDESSFLKEQGSGNKDQQDKPS